MDFRGAPGLLCPTESTGRGVGGGAEAAVWSTWRGKRRHARAEAQGPSSVGAWVLCMEQCEPLEDFKQGH